MALRRSRVRIPLGPQNDVGHVSNVTTIQVMAGVVGHPVSELGDGQSPGGSPATVSNGYASKEDRTRLLSRKRDFAGEGKLGCHPTYSSQRRESPLSQKRGKSKLISTYNSGGTAERYASFVPDVDEGFFV